MFGAVLVAACQPLQPRPATLLQAHPSFTGDALAKGGITVGGVCSRGPEGAQHRPVLREAVVTEIDDYTDVPVSPPDAIESSLGAARALSLAERLCSDQALADAELKELLPKIPTRYVLFVRIDAEHVQRHAKETRHGNDVTETYSSERIIDASFRIFDDRLAETVWLTRLQASASESSSVPGASADSSFLEMLLSDILARALYDTDPDPPTPECAYSKLFRELAERLPRPDQRASTDDVAAPFDSTMKCDDHQRWRRAKLWWE